MPQNLTSSANWGQEGQGDLRNIIMPSLPWEAIVTVGSYKTHINTSTALLVAVDVPFTQ